MRSSRSTAKGREDTAPMNGNETRRRPATSARAENAKSNTVPVNGMLPYYYQEAA
jgi:hypothetical protein